MNGNFTLENDWLRLISSVFWIGGSLTLLFVNIRAVKYDLATQTIGKEQLKCEMERMEKQLHKLKNKL